MHSFRNACRFRFQHFRVDFLKRFEHEVKSSKAIDYLLSNTFLRNANELLMFIQTASLFKWGESLFFCVFVVYCMGMVLNVVFSTLTNPSFFLDKCTWYSTWLFSGFFFCSDHLFSDQLYMEMQVSPQLQEIVTNGSMVLSVISYKNLTNFLPRMYFERNT